MSDSGVDARPRMLSRRLVLAGGAAAGLAAFTGAAVQSATPAKLVSRGPTDRPVVALTFDGGSDRGDAMGMLNTLANHGVKCTFPLTGQFAIANPDVVQRMVAEGHHLANHSFDHPSFTGFMSGVPAVTSEAAQRRQLDNCEAALVNAGGIGGKPWFRPPYGDYNQQLLRVLGESGFETCLMWTLDVLGWNGLSVTQIVNRVMANHGNGYIYLLHIGGASRETQALNQIITGLRSNGYGFATIPDLLAGTSVPPPAQFAVGDTVRVTDGLYLRTAPNLTGSVITTMPTGTMATVLGGPSPADGYVWYQLQTPYGTGWAATVSLAKSTSTTPTPVPTPGLQVGDIARVTAGLYLRSNPGTSSSVIVTMPTGTTCTILAGPSPMNGLTWYQVDTPYGTGWAAGEYLARTGTAPTTPTPTAPPTTTPEPGPSPTPPTSTPPPTGDGFAVGESVRVTTSLKLRTAASTNATVRVTMPAGTVCTVKGGPVSANGYRWYQLQTPYGEGWAAGEYLARTTSTPPPTSGGWPTGARVRTNAANLRLRQSASTSAGIVATMPLGTTGTVVGGPQTASGYTWYRIETVYGTGWAAQTYLTRVT